MLFDTVYECDLHSITSDIRVNQDWNKKANIAAAETKIVAKVMVQPTFNPNIYKEIITGTLIPAYKTTLKKGITHLDEEIYYTVPKKPVFIKINENCFYMKYTSDLVVAKAEDIKRYIEYHSRNVLDFKTQLDYIFQTAENYYENAALKNNYSEKRMVKILLKSLRKK